jgi:two-component system, OmpR family, response regulator VicR
MNEMPKILYVEDDPTLGFVTQDNLNRRGYDVFLCDNGKKGIEAFNNQAFDIVVLDVMLPLLDGISMAKYIRQHNKEVPIIFLTARAMLEDKLEGLSSGGDDYIVKPFSIEELVLKIEVFLKRSKVVAQKQFHEASQIGKFVFDPQLLTLSNNGHEQKLTLREAELLAFFIKNEGKLMAREEIQKAIWGSDDYFTGRSLDVFISRIRKYLKQDPALKIENRHGIGFIFSR